MHSRDLDELPAGLQQSVKDELRPGEQVRWAGQPVPKSYPWLMLYVAVWGLFTTLFMLYWMSGAAGLGSLLDLEIGVTNLSPLRVGFALLGTPGVVFGLGLLAAPYWLPRQVQRSAEQTAYVITSQRALIIDGGYHSGARGYLQTGLATLWRKVRKVRSFGAQQLSKIERAEHEDGSGDLILDHITSRDSEGDEQTTLVGFFSLPQVRKVGKMLGELSSMEDHAP